MGGYRRWLGILASEVIDSNFAGCSGGLTMVWFLSAAAVMTVVFFILGSGGLAVLLVTMGDKILEWIENRLQQGGKD